MEKTRTLFLRLMAGTVLGAFLSGCAISLLGGPKLDPSLTWQVISTDHFRIYYHQGEDRWAQKAARIAEQVHAVLAPKLGWEPAEPTHLILIDYADATSGAALPFPNNSIYINLTPPPANPVPFLVGFDDWLQEVILHEYVHILQLDMNTGFPALMRAVFGRQPLPLLIFNGAMPNIFQPAWLIEGLATYEETATGVSDRRDNPYTEMVLRMAVLENRFPSLDQAGGRDTWPGNQLQYLFGARFYDYLARRFGEQVLKDLSLEYSDNVFPFFVDSTARQILGQSYVTLWNQWQNELKERFRQQKESVEALGLTPSRRITDRGDYNLGPKVSPDGRRLVYATLNPHEYPSLRMMDSEGGQDRFAVRRNLGYTVSWSPDGKQLAFSQLELYRNHSEYSDLYLYDFTRNRLKRLTTGARLRDPDFDPTETRLISVENRLGKNRLVVYDLETGGMEVIDWTDREAILTHPRWSPDGRRIALGVWQNGLQGIGLLDLEQKRSIPLFMDHAADLTPAWSPDGKYILLSSDRTGIYNLFAYEVETGGLFQITSVLGGAFTPEITPDGREILFSAYTSRGFDLHRMVWDPSTWKKVEIPASPSIPARVEPESSLAFPTEPYSSWPTVRPRFWTPLLGVDESGSQVGAATGGLDVLGRHRYDAVALYGAATHRPAFSIQYENESFYPSLHVGISSLAVRYPDLLMDGQGLESDYWERRTRLDLDITLSRLFFESAQFFTAGYRVQRFSGLTRIPGDVPAPEEGDLSGLRFSWRLGTAKEYGFSISREDGRQLLISYEWLNHGLGSDLDQNRYIASWHEYQGLYWPHHVLAARLTGAVARGDRLTQGSFQVGGPTFAEEIVDPEQTEFFLRGYPSRLLRGRKAAVGSLEYRLPLQNIERGISTWPFFFQRTHADFFFDIGNAWNNDTTLSEFRRGVGVEIKMDMIAGHLLPLRLRLGFAKGLDEGGERQTYFTIGNSF